LAYQPIENYGIIGNMRTVALVGLDGSIDWFCFPIFDSPSVFGAILDDGIGGRFKIAPTSARFKTKQFYWPETNILVTRFLSPDGVAEIIDYMPIHNGLCHNSNPPTLIRRVHVIRGALCYRMECRPAFNYARDQHDVAIDGTSARFHSAGLHLGLAAEVPLEREDSAAVAEFTLSEGQTTVFCLEELRKERDNPRSLSWPEEEELFSRTVDFWRRWLSSCTYTGRWREIVQRSALVLKLLSYEPTGAIVAAPTCSLPERIGGARNWDYRYTWIRDSAFTIYALLRIGFTEEAANFMNWLDRRCHELNPDNSLQIMYGIDGRHTLNEETLDHLDGYRGSRPVRIGNGAYRQLQLDIYGELMDSVYLSNKYSHPISYELWSHLRRLLNWVCDNWREKDEGIWEVRGGRDHFIFSKLMCWVALDRGMRLADKRSFPSDHARWRDVRDQIYTAIQEKGWNPDVEAFVQSFGSDVLDASSLIMPLIFFLSPTDPRMLKTLDAISRPPNAGGLVSNSLVYRYNVEESSDGLPGTEGTFNICTFWLVEAMTRAGRKDRKRLEDARLIFEQMLGHANHLGLYAEEIGLSGEALGNFPQGFTHLALISAAFNLDRALGSVR
jgi:GH15 family glucan-1,4-alpha-glucosidase